jgi:hypothetical protein
MPDFNFEILLDHLRNGWMIADETVTYTLANGPVDRDRGFLIPLTKGDQTGTLAVGDGSRIRDYLQERRLRCLLDSDFYSLYDGLIERFGWGETVASIDRGSFQALLDSIVDLVSSEFGACLTYLKLFLPGLDLFADGAAYTVAENSKGKGDEGLFRRLQFDPSDWLPEMTGEPIYAPVSMRDVVHRVMRRAGGKAMKKFRAYLDAMKNMGVVSESYHPLKARVGGKSKIVGILNLHFATEKSAYQLSCVQDFIESKLPDFGLVLMTALERTFNVLLLRIASEATLGDAEEIKRLFIRSLGYEASPPSFEPVKVEDLIQDVIAEGRAKKYVWGRDVKRLTWNCDRVTMSNALKQLILVAESLSAQDRITIGAWGADPEKFFRHAVYLLPGEGKKKVESVIEKSFFKPWSMNDDLSDVRRVVADATAFCHAGYTGTLRYQDGEREKDTALISVP